MYPQWCTTVGALIAIAEAVRLQEKPKKENSWLTPRSEKPDLVRTKLY